jgi:hypothetical protein
MEAGFIKVSLLPPDGLDVAQVAAGLGGALMTIQT